MPATWPRIQLLGSGFGQEVSIWKPPEASRVGTCAQPAARANPATAKANAFVSRFMPFSSGPCLKVLFSPGDSVLAKAVRGEASLGVASIFLSLSMDQQVQRTMRCMPDTA